MMNLRPLYWVILCAVVAACSGKVALRHRPRRDAVHHYVLTMRYSRDDAPIVASVARTDQVWTIYYTQSGASPTDAARERGLAPNRFGTGAPPGADPDLSSMNGATILAYLDGAGSCSARSPTPFLV